MGGALRFARRRGSSVHPRLDTFRRILARAQHIRGVALMGVCNVTPDSFSDGGFHFAPAAARARVEELIAEGADFVDIGGESTRPGAPAVAAGEQLDRVLGAVRHAVGLEACVSVDTTSPVVAEACLREGACAINDVSCLRDPSLAVAVAEAGAALILMHTRGTPDAMRAFGDYPEHGYADVVADVCAEWDEAALRARRNGVPAEALVMDPGLGFAKSARQSVALMRRLPELVRRANVPVAVGASRKSFLTFVDSKAAPRERLGGSISAALHAARAGAAIVRVHDVRATRQALDVSRELSEDATHA
jgi:dihydropteroate synthase